MVVHRQHSQRRSGKCTIHRLTFLLPVIAATLLLNGQGNEAPGAFQSENGREQTTVPDSRPAEGNLEFAPTKIETPAAPGLAPKGMVWIPGGEFSMGSEDARELMCGGPDAMPDARAIHRVRVNGFWMDAVEVTNEQFEKFVKATGYVTVAEQTPNEHEFPQVPRESLVAGSLVFTPTANPVPLNDYLHWWRYEKGANWRHPEGTKSNIKDHERYPAVHVAYADAMAFAKWAGKQLPTEAEW